MLGLVGHMVSIAIAQLCRCRVERALSNILTDERGSAPTKSHLQNQQAGQISLQAIVCQLLT